MALCLQCAPRIAFQLHGRDSRPPPRVRSKLRGREAPSPAPSPLPKCVAASGAALGLMLLPTSVAFAAAQDNLGWIRELLSEEPTNALSLQTWTIHVASVVEWVVAMILVWQYGGTKNNVAWKGLTWGMVPLLGGALCACTWHFFYNAESLEVLVVMQGALTLVGNITLWIAAYRIYQSSSSSSSSS